MASASKKMENEQKAMDTIMRNTVPSMFQLASDRKEQLQNFQVLIEWCKQANVVPFEVPADGNCGAWSLLSLDRGGPLQDGADEAFLEMSLAIRAEISQGWKDVARDPKWQQFFCRMVATFDSTKPADVKQENVSTPVRKKKSADPVFIDLSTPEQPPKKVHRVGAAREALGTKPQKPTGSQSDRQRTRRQVDAELASSMPGGAKKKHTATGKAKGKDQKNRPPRSLL